MMTPWHGASRSVIAAVGVVASLTLAACGGGDSGSGGMAPVASPITGTFVDSLVNGLHYTSVPSNPAGGLTANGGQYQCVPGDTVTFDLGGRVIGSGQPCGEQVTVLSVFGATSITDIRVRNLAQLFLTLSGIPAGSQPIELPATIPATLPTRLDFSNPNFEQMLQAALPDKTLVTQEQVLAHLRSSFTTLTVVTNGGKITSIPAGLVCTTGICSHDFVAGTRVTLAAVGDGFTGWSGTAGCAGIGTCQVLLTAMQAIRAVFVAPSPPPPGGGGTLTITGAPASVGGKFIVSSSLTLVKPPDPQTNIASVAWSEAVIPSPIHSEILAIAFDATNNIPQASAMGFSLFHGSVHTIWSCVEFLNACGITVSGVTGTVTFNNSVLTDLVSGAPPITLNGTVTFTPITISATSLNITTASPLAAGTVNQAYSVTLATSGGTQPFTWGVVSGALPAGLTLNAATGQISGTPTTEGAFTFTVGLIDSATPQRSNQKSFALTVAASSLQPNIPIIKTLEEERDPQIVSDGFGGAIIVWSAGSNDGTANIYAQRVNSAGVKLWSPIGIPVSVAVGDQGSPQIISDGAGGAIIAWSDSRGDLMGDIFAQRINSAGTAQWAANGVPVATVLGSWEKNFRLAPDGTGGIIIAWERGLLSEPGIYAQRINGTGVVQWAVDGVLIGRSTLPFRGDQVAPQIVADGVGGAFITWQNQALDSGDQIFAQRVSPTGLVQWATDGVLLTDYPSRFGHWLGGGSAPQIVGDGAGGVIVAWLGFNEVNNGIFAQRLNSSGIQQWTLNGVLLFTSAPSQFGTLGGFMQLTSDGSSGAIVAWDDRRNNANTDIYAQRVNGAGAVQWTTDGVAISTGIGDQDSPILIADNAGGAIIVWNDKRKISEYDIYAQRVNNAGVVQWAANGVGVSTAALDQTVPVLTTDGAGGAFIAWADWRDVSNFWGVDVYAQRITSAGLLP